MINQDKNQPIDRIRQGSAVAAIWKHATSDGSQFYKATIECRYKDGDGNWQSTTSFGRSELLQVAKLADRVESRIRELLDANVVDTVNA